MTIAVLDYGMGNLRSVARAVEHVGGKAEVADDRGAVMLADALVVPGVGHFGACMRNLAQDGLDGVVRDFAATGRPLFGVCVGMQVMFRRSEEDPEEGLGIIPGQARRLPPTVKVPHMGWNTVEWVSEHRFVHAIPDGTRFYFVHSYAADVLPGTTVGTTEYGRPFSAVVARDNLFATQFHPEKSGEAGLGIYEAFVKEATA
ncbi:MAG: imidazole glycerol phosphate synthase subunit HisH [Actinomycetota bacterium]